MSNSSRVVGQVNQTETDSSITVHTGNCESTFTKTGSLLERTGAKTVDTFVGPFSRELADSIIARWALEHGCTTIKRKTIEYTLAYDAMMNIQVFHCGILQKIFCKADGSDLNRLSVNLRNKFLPGGVNFL